MMTKTVLIIILGDPASGKTTLARRLCSDASLPCLCKDDIKEAMFDMLGVADRAGSRRFSDASFAALLKLGGTQLSLGQSCVLEGNWRLEHATAIADLLTTYDARAGQILCTASSREVERRFLARVRHPGHLDADSRSQPTAPASTFLAVDGPRWTYDSGDAAQYPRLLERLKMWRL